MKKVKNLSHTKKVTIGPYKLNREHVTLTPPNIIAVASSTTKNTLNDPEMGVVDKLTNAACRDDFSKCFGTNGIITLSTPIIHPSFYDPLLRFLKLFGLEYDEKSYKLTPVSGIAEAIKRHSEKIEYRKMKSIVSDVEKNNPGSWSIDDKCYMVYTPAKSDKADKIHISPSQLRDMLVKLSARMTKDNVGKDNVHLTYKMLGINSDVARPEDTIVGFITVMQNALRAPMAFGGQAGMSKHVYTKIYEDLIVVSKKITPDYESEVTKVYKRLLDGSGGDQSNEQFNLKNNIFSGKKENFIRGKMFSKTSGQVIRSVVTPEPRLSPDEIGIPRYLAKEVSQRVLVTANNYDQCRQLIADGAINYIMDKSTGEYIKLKRYNSTNELLLKAEQTYVLRELQDGDVVLANRQPSLHRNSMLGFKVVLHDDSTIKIHPSATKGFAMDFDGDESNCYVMISDDANMEVRKLMLISYHMASLASSSLLVGYHQDVSISVHMLTMDATILAPPLWHRLASTVYDILYKDSYPSYRKWLTEFYDRCNIAKINLFSGRGLYSTMLPKTFNWKLGSCQTIKGILVSGTLDARTTSGTSNSLGMIIYRVYGPDVCIKWLNASYTMLNEYLLFKGLTLGFKDIELTSSQNTQINTYIASNRERQDLLFNIDSIEDSVLRARKEIEITQELNNVRESISMIIMKPSDTSITNVFKGITVDRPEIQFKKYKVLDRKGVLNTIPIDDDEDMDDVYYPEDSDEDRLDTYIDSYEDNESLVDNAVYTTIEVKLPSYVDNMNSFQLAHDGEIEIDFYKGYIKFKNDTDYYWSMGIVDHIRCDIKTIIMVNDVPMETIVSVDRKYVTPNQLLMMIESGARGNATNVVQMAGIVGQQTYESGRIPRMMEDTSITINDMIYSGPRSLPCYVPGENSPQSRGFVDQSYRQGLSPSNYYNIHVASRENLTSNQNLTPDTGYFSRRVRVFIENLQMKKIEGKLVAVNERDVIVMMDYVFDPSRMFKIGNTTTFVDVKYEIDQLTRNMTKSAIYIPIPYYKDIRNYTKYDERLRKTIELNSTKDIILAINSKIITHSSDYYQYLRDILPVEIKASNINIITIPANLHGVKRNYWYLSLVEYKSIAVVPLFAASNACKEYKFDKKIPDDVSAYIDISKKGINRISYDIESESEIPLHTLYQMFRNGNDFEDLPMIINNKHNMWNNIDKYSLLDTLILSGKIMQL